MSGIIEKAPVAKETKGHFKIEARDTNNNIIDSYEDNNLIVFEARKKMASLLASKARKGVTKILLGTRGHNTNTGNILEPKVVGQDGYEETRTNTFSEAEQEFFYTIQWNPDNLLDKDNGQANWVGNTISFIATGNPMNSATENARVPVTITITENTTEFKIEVPETAANGTDGRSVVSYTEAGLFCETEMFSIKCFPAKVKDVSTSFSIIWRIIF